MDYEIIEGDCLEVMKTFPDGCIDLTVTSPPYDNLRTYNGNISQWNELKWKNVIDELYRITKRNGVVVWVVGDATVKGSETATSFKQCLWAIGRGFNLHDTMIYLKDQLAFPDSNRYYNAFEYMFVWSKGNVITFNPIKDRKNKSAKRFVHGTERKKDGSLRNVRSCAGKMIQDFGVRWNYWLMYNQSRGEHSKHPATFPEALARDHIISWSNKGDVILDPFMGSGTTGKMAIQLNRKFIGIEKQLEYCEIARARLLATVEKAKKVAEQLEF